MSALVFSNSIFKASGCCCSSSLMRSLNEASSRRRCSISVLLSTGPTDFQTLCAGILRSPDGHAFVNPNRGQKSKLCRRGCDRPDDSANSDNQKKAPALEPNRSFSLERFRAKACPGLDPGWIPVRVKKTRQNKYLEPRSYSIGTEKGPGLPQKQSRTSNPRIAEGSKPSLRCTIVTRLY